MEISEISDIISKIGAPAAGAVGMGYLFYLVLQWMMKVIIVKLDGIESMVVKLIDRIRMLDNDLIRLNQKVNTVLHLRGKTIEYERVEAEKEINKQVLSKSDDKEVAGGSS